VAFFVGDGLDEKKSTARRQTVFASAGFPWDKRRKRLANQPL
jgi:hypothetical protein